MLKGLLPGSSGEADVENRHAAVGEGGEGRRAERVTWTLAQPSARRMASGDVLCASGNSNGGSASTQRGGMWWERGGRFKREGMCVCLWLIHLRLDRKQQNL